MCLILHIIGVNQLFAVGKVAITGIVYDEMTKEPLIGATVTVKDSKSGAATDFNGKFSLDVPSENSIITISYIGYRSQEISINGKTNIVVYLEENTKKIDEIVVVGYGTQKKSDLTGSVASVGAGEIQKLSVSNVAESLKGKISGVSISTVDASPGGSSSIKIRGFNTISGTNEPLIVVDGYTNAGDLNSINPRDIKSIEVLKDASSTAIYGARGANGVILITTNSGATIEKTKIDFSIASTTKNLSKKLDMMNAQQFLTMQNEAVGGGPIANLDSYQTTDWQDLIQQTGMLNNYQLSISGGGKKTSYLVSGNYLTDKGVIKKSDFNRFSVRMKTDTKLTDWLSFSNSIYFMRSTTNGTPRNTMGYGSDPSITDAALTFYPHLSIKDGNGDYTNMSFKTNPLAVIEGRTDLSVRNNIYDYAELNLTPIKGLLIKMTLGGTFDYNTQSQYWSSIVKNVAGSLGGIANKNNFANKSWSNENTVTYQGAIKKHNFTITGGFTQEYFGSERNGIKATGFLNDALSYNNLGGAKNVTVNSSTYETTLMSGLGRIFYNYNSKYYITASGRLDGCSRFAENNKWGFFPAVALAWRLSEENFLKEQDKISNLKLRVSLGQTGNYSALGPYQSLTSWTPSTLYSGIFNNIAQNILAPSNLGNPELGWETSNQFDVGVDLGLFNDRINIVADYYHKITTDLLLSVQLPAVSLLPTRFENVGEVQNDGLELSINSKNIESKNFTWSSTITYSLNRNKVVNLNGQNYILGGPFAGVLQDEPGVIMVGKPLGSFWGYVYEGVFADNKVYQNDKVNYAYLPDASKPEGYIKLKDLNQDGKIDNKDRTVIGSAQPDFAFGFVNNFSYKSFDLSVFIEGVVGGDVYNLQRYVIDNGNGETNVSTRLLDRWSPTNRNSEYVGAGKFIPKGNSQFIEDGTYIKFRDIQLGYTMPEKLLKKIFIKDLRAYLSMQNFFTITKYTGYDPEVNMQGGSSSYQNMDLGAYPTAKSITVGLNFGF